MPSAKRTTHWFPTHQLLLRNNYRRNNFRRNNFRRNYLIPFLFRSQRFSKLLFQSLASRNGKTELKCDDDGLFKIWFLIGKSNFFVYHQALVVEKFILSKTIILTALLIVLVILEPQDFSIFFMKKKYFQVKWVW